jgi:uncharacterized 2Fe-2S/4Fe-4S cluster protein (DUF4445 family)
MTKKIFVTDARGAKHAIELPERIGDSQSPGLTLAQAVFASGLFDAPALCSGLGRCGRCRVRYLDPKQAPAVQDESEARTLGAAELALGWRLACRRPAQGGERIFVPASPVPTTLVFPSLIDEPELKLAVDLGTTSLHWEALNARDGAVAAKGSGLNPQLGAGAEVMSRLAFAANPANARRLRRLVLDRLALLVNGLSAAGGRVTEICLAGNTAMVSILHGKRLDGLSAAPYRLDYAGHERVDLGAGLGEKSGLALPPAYIPPLYSPFVGADLSAGLASVSLGLDARPGYPFLLADLGTNGEFILAVSPERYLAASVAMGPALEGVGLSCGGLAGPGAVVGFGLTPTGIKPMLYTEPSPSEGQGAAKPETRVTGAGYLSLIALLLKTGALDASGRFQSSSLPGRSDPATPLGRKLAQAIVLEHGAPRLVLPVEGLWLDAADVEELLKVKAAFNYAFAHLLSEAGIEVSALRAVYLAGALGAHAGVENLETLGFLPPGIGARTQVLGNSSLAGCRLFLRNPQARDWAAAVGARLQTLDLAASNSFGAGFLTRMTFAYAP